MRKPRRCGGTSKQPERRCSKPARSAARRGARSRRREPTGAPRGGVRDRAGVSEQVLGALLAGLIAGAAAAFAMTAITMILLVRSAQTGWVTRLPGWERVRPSLLGVLIVNLQMFLWTGLGLVLGALYL